MNTRAGANRSTGQIWWLTACIASIAIVGWRVWGLDAPSTRAPIEISWLIVLVGFALAELLLVHFDFRKETHALTLGEVPLVIGLVFCTPGGLLFARLGGSMVALAGHFRQSREKLCFNLAMHALKVLGALAVYRAVLGDASAVSARGWAAAFLGAAAADAISHVAIVGAITITDRRPTVAAMAPMLMTCVITAFTNTSLALLSVIVIWYQPSAAWMLVCVAGVYAVGYRAHTAIRQRYANLERLYRFTRALSGAVAERDVIDAVLRESAELLRSDHAELAVRTSSGVTRYSRGPDGELNARAAAPTAIEGSVLESGASLLVPEHSHHAHSLLVATGVKDAIAVPVGDAGRAVLVVADRVGEVTTFDMSDLRLFESLANHAAIALQSGELLERLRDEVAAKEHQALHDQLTGLANRTLFAEQVEEYLASPQRDITTVMLMDLDRFKEINDTLGHYTGDMVLRHVAARLVHVTGNRGTVARLGGDEFAIVSQQPLGERGAISFARELVAAAESPVAIDEMVLEAAASVGIALAPMHGTDAATLLQRADVAMYDAKKDNKGIAVYEPDKDHYTPRRLLLVAELRSALADGALELYYQPQIDLSNGAVRCVEALLRWNHPTHGFIPPDEFIPVAEQSGLMAPLTRWVMDTALGQVSAWRGSGLDLSVAVNVSARNLADPNLVAEIEFLLMKHGVEAEHLVVELTETSVMTDLAQAVGMLDRIAATGAKLSIDDFGTGYSSLSRLARLPVSEVKVDRQFVMGMTQDHSNAVIVRSTIDLARGLGLRVVAEGVEDDAALSALAELHCDAVQGYLLCRPVPAADLTSWLQSRSAGRVMVR